MNGFIRLSGDERRLYCEQAAARLGLPAASVEKDFWVCWTLRLLFGLSRLDKAPDVQRRHVLVEGLATDRAILRRHRRRDRPGRSWIRRARRSGKGAEPQAAAEAPRSPQGSLPETNPLRHPTGSQGGADLEPPRWCRCDHRAGGTRGGSRPANDTVRIPPAFAVPSGTSAGL